MAASLQKVPVTASLINTSRGIKFYDGDDISKESAVESVASGNWPRSTTPPRRGWQSMHWSGSVKHYARVLEGNTSSSVNVGGARRSHYLRGCVSVFGHKATCVFELVFSAFLITECTSFSKKQKVKMRQSYIADVMNATLMFPTRSALIAHVMVPVSYVETTDVISAAWRYI